jgi:two-component system invasion response regulator UvrY
MRILVVDDNPTVRRYYRALLEQQAGWRVCAEARNGQEALQEMRTTLPDVVLMDFQLPDTNGIEVARQITQQWPAIPILMVSVHYSTQLAATAQAAGIRGACAKSDISSIVTAVETILQHQTYFPSPSASG